MGPRTHPWAGRPNSPRVNGLKFAMAGADTVEVMQHWTAQNPRAAHGWRGSRLGRVYRHRRVRSDRGAALVEAAIILPVLMVFLLGIIEFGLVYATGATATGASRSGARLAAASFGPNPPAVSLHNATNTGPGDNAAAAVSADLTALTSATPIGVVIYAVDKTKTDGQPVGGFPAKTNTMPGCSTKCLRYTWNDTTKKMVFQSGTLTPADFNVCSSNPVANPLGSIGVWVLIRHSYLTKLIGQYNYVEGMTVMRIEPVPSEQCA